MSSASRSRSRWIAALLCLAALAAGSSCTKSPTSPKESPPKPTMRSVTVVVQDSTGAAVAGATLFATGLDDANAGQTVASVNTDAEGASTFSLLDGHWLLSARSGPFGGPFRVAGSTGVVASKPAGSPDTTQFRLVVRTQSIARGTITLTGRITHDGTLVGVLGFPILAITGSDGSYELDGLPPGSWVAYTAHDGFVPAQFSVDVPGPAQTITLAPFALAANAPARP
jgi:hypothetical protein